MISRIEIDGFRSLIDFQLDMRPGLNIMVGPNGAGKTNIILFFEFLTSLIDNQLSEAINRCGGAGSIFRKTEDGGFVKEIRVNILGYTESPYAKSELRYIQYQYEFTIGLSHDDDFVFFKQQKFSISSNKKRMNDQSWDLVLWSDFDEESQTNTTKIKSVDFRKAPENAWRFAGQDSLTKANKTRAIEAMLNRSIDWDRPLPTIASVLMTEARDVVRDFASGNALNVEPAIAKKYEDSATAPGIRRNGGGLAATLYSLDRLENSNAPRVKMRPRPAIYRNSSPPFLAAKGTLSKINEYVRLVNDEIIKIAVRKDHDDNNLKIFVTLKGTKKDLSLPFAFMSDGTIKWITLVTAIFTNREMFAIEEPENFIHPAMQQEILDLMRNARGFAKKDNFVLMTTHSETLLNAAAPDEVITVRMENGRTIPNRPQNPEELKSEINRSGFGLGYLYLAGALENG
ncbi:putative ATPase [Loktanella ponticola]|uniref:Putative ATPase n=1 Tax=Yoonia ponticola TaxID=1524255 RepID=A0A7W9BIK5_9RHOB|nr:AAA family ATPase [Yoonia ponticola]MBB5720976.1 putative ATPase [Yoonia ponticola]